MKKSLTINATRAGKKVSKNIGYVNPDVANSLVGGFAQMVNALSNDTFVNSQVVKVMDTTEEEQTTPTPTPAPAGKQEGIITINGSRNPIFSAPGNYTVTYNGDAPFLYLVIGSGSGSFNQDAMTLTITEDTTGYIFASYTDNFTAASAPFSYVVD